MFSVEDAEALRESLPPLDFSAPAGDNPLVERYRDFYGLRFDIPEPRYGIGRFDSGPFRIVCQHFRPARPTGTVFVLHGYYDHAGLYAHLIRHCVKSSLAVVICDLPGHGLSSGEQASIDSFDSYSEMQDRCFRIAGEQQVPAPWHVIAQSTGAAAVMNRLLNGGGGLPEAVDKIIFLAPLLRPVGWYRSRLYYLLLHRFVTSRPRAFSPNSHDREFLEFIRKHDTLQCLSLPVPWVGALIEFLRRFYEAPPCEREIHIIQGTDDGTVDWRYNLRRLGKKFPRARTRIIKNARHHMVNESLEYRERIFTAIDEVLSP